MLAGLLSLLACVGPVSKSLASESVVLVAELPSACSGATTVWFSVLAGSRCCARTWAHGTVRLLCAWHCRCQYWYFMLSKKGKSAGSQVVVSYSQVVVRYSQAVVRNFVKVKK